MWWKVFVSRLWRLVTRCFLNCTLKVGAFNCLDCFYPTNAHLKDRQGYVEKPCTHPAYASK